MHVLFKVKGDAAIGLGHIERSLELAREVSRRAGAHVAFWVNDDPVSREKVASQGIGIEGGDDDPEAFAACVAAQGVDAVIFDQPGELTDFTARLRSRPQHPWLAALDYFNFAHADLDLIVNLCNHNLEEPRPRFPSVQYHEGPQFAIVRSAFGPYVSREKLIPQAARHLLISFGGSDPQRNTRRVLEALRGRDLRGLDVHVVFGAHLPDRQALRQVAAGLSTPVHVYEDVPNIEELMSACDLSLSGAGTTMLEVAAVGTPALIMAQSVEELRFAATFTAAGAVECLGQAGRVSGAAVWDAVERLAHDRQARAAMSRAGKRLVDGRGSERIAALILDGVSVSRERLKVG